jgi:hypothetical protein
MMFRRRKKRRDPFCGCGHHLALHDRQTGVCHHTESLYDTTLEIIKNANGNPVKNDFGEVQTVKTTTLAGTEQCGCRQYIGPEQIQLYTAAPIYLPPVAGDET